MARSVVGADAQTRAYLLAQEQDFRRLMVDTLLGDSVESAQFAWDVLSAEVDSLASGRACPIHRYELPYSHPLASRGDPSQYLVIGEDDVVREP